MANVAGIQLFQCLSRAHFMANVAGIQLFQSQKRLRLSWEMDECKPLPTRAEPFRYLTRPPRLPSRRARHWFPRQLHMRVALAFI